jgi:hypothetical protein
MRHSLLIAALAVTTIGGGAAHADTHSLPCIAVAAGCSATPGRGLDGKAPDAETHPGTLKVAEMESHGRGEDNDDDDRDNEDEDEGEDDAAGGSPGILPIPQSGAPATVPAPKNPLLNGSGRPSVVVQ